LKVFKDDPLIAAPGTKYVYTTYGWQLLAACIEKVLPNGCHFAPYMLNFCRDQLGLKNTYLHNQFHLVPNRSRVYKNVVNQANGKTSRISVPYNDLLQHEGGLMCTASDLLQFGNIVLYSYLGTSPDGSEKGFLRRETMKELLTPHPLSYTSSQFIGYGMGFNVPKNDKSISAFCGEPEGCKYFGHTGWVGGATACLYIEPQSETVVVIMRNTESSISSYEVASRIARNFNRSPSYSRHSKN